jgi:SulP family sulfate permease
MKQHQDDITLSPFKNELQNYSLEYLRKDLFAALSVVLITVPQCMAYALLAGVPISCGLIAAIYSAIVAALFGSSRHLVIGPSNALALLLMSGTSGILFTYYRDLEGVQRTWVAMQILTQITLVTGIIQIFGSCFKLGRLTQFVSSSVILGYMAGTAVAVGINQLYPFLGVTPIRGVFSIYEKATYLITHINLIHWPTAFIGFGSCGLYFFLKKLNRHFPAGVTSLTVASVAVSAMELINPNFIGVILVGHSTDGFTMTPELTLPILQSGVFNAVLPIAFAIAMLSMMETTSVAKSIASSSGQTISSNQELLALGLGNLTSSIVVGLPVSGSISRSQMNYECGAQTRFAAIYSAILVTVFVFGFSFFLNSIPLAAMASLLLVTSAGIVNTRRMLICYKATKADAAVLLITFLSCIFLSLDVAFYIGIIISITLYLRKAAVPQLIEYELAEKGQLRRISPERIDDERTIRIIKVEGELFFGAADPFQSTLKTLAEDHSSTNVIILQLKNARDMDATACLALEHLHKYLRKSGRHLIACGMTPHIWEVFRNSGIDRLIGNENLFCVDENTPHQYLQRAWKRAEELSLKVPRPEAKAIAGEMAQPNLA